MTTVLALGCVVVMASWWGMATAIPLLAAHTTALIMGGTGHPLVGPKDTAEFVTSYLDNAVVHYLNPASTGPVTNAVAVFTPEEFFPMGRLTLDESVAEGHANLQRCLAAGMDCVFNDDPAVVSTVGPSAAPRIGDFFQVFGFSQSAMIASLAKLDLIGDYQTGDAAVPFMLVANPMRPNGGVLMRGKGLPTIPILGISFIGSSPTDSAMLADGAYANPTVDIARQYDGLGGDFPVRPLNLLALVNALLGYVVLHGETVEVPFDEAQFQGSEGDTSYYLIETDVVPILQPLALLLPAPILKAMDAPLRVIIEDAYDRDIGPGTPTPMSWWPTKDVFALAGNLIRSVPVAVDNLFQGFGLSRPLGTEAPGPYGVGGRALPQQSGGAGAAGSAHRAGGPTRDTGGAEGAEPAAEPATHPTRGMPDDADQIAQPPDPPEPVAMDNNGPVVQEASEVPEPAVGLASSPRESEIPAAVQAGDDGAAAGRDDEAGDDAAGRDDGAGRDDAAGRDDENDNAGDTVDGYSTASDRIDAAAA
ncbi:MAG: PE-PPE domain-containing protein [Mycolicibacterium sp.]|uniref:PE-PPE domain-containing protein n=1 Tax=Mycolicibacterium sp. TaxID=2320850 RepID=UPI003D0FD72B